MTWFSIGTVMILLVVNPSFCQRFNHGTDALFEQTNHELRTLTIPIVKFLTTNFKLNCIALITDEVYLNLFNGEWFYKATNLSYIMTVVKESEDLLSPNYDTLESIKLVRREGCKLYLIFLSNGIQASRLLKFGDRHRILDTRAKFIMMHDFRLFRPDSHYIWKRIIDVIFFRRFTGDAKSSRFELSTVIYPPLTVQNILVPRRVTTWKNKQKLEKEFLFKDKTLNLKEHIIKVVVLEHVPAVLQSNKSYTGIEIQIIRAISKAMNFKTKIYETADAKRERWGQKQLNGSFNGLLGEMVDGKADIALGNLHYTPYHLQISDLTIPYISECLTFLTPESQTDNSWKTLILPFKLYMWVTVLVVLLVSGFIFFGLAKLHKYITKEEVNSEARNKNLGLFIFDEITNSILYTYGMLLVVSLPKLPSSWSIRLLTGWYWLYCILVAVSYRASMTAILANPAPKVTIDTMVELAENPIECGGWGQENKNFFFTSLDEIGQKIGNKFKIIDDPYVGVQKVAKGELAYYENTYFLSYISAKSKNKSGNDVEPQTYENSTVESHIAGETRNLHIMKDCAIHMPISIGLQKNSPLKPRIDKLLRKIIEAGLIQKWLDDVMVPILTADSTEEENIKALMNLQKLYGGFVALGIGYFFSFIALIIEIIHWNKIVKKDPNFDKYAMERYYAIKKTKTIF